MSRPAAPAHEPQPDPVMAVADLVDQQPRGARAVADEHVGVAVVVDVAERRAAPASSSSNTVPACADHILELSTASCGTAVCAVRAETDRRLRLSVLTFWFTSPFTVSRSSQPSLSKSNQAVPKPVYGRLGRADAGRALCSSKVPVPSLTYRSTALAGQLGDEQILVAVIVEVAGVDTHARLCAYPRRRAPRPRGAPCS